MLRVRVVLDIEVDTVAWADTYWTPDIPADVKRYALLSIAESTAAHEGAIVRVTLQPSPC